jgi:hypothetical protein
MSTGVSTQDHGRTRISHLLPLDLSALPRASFFQRQRLSHVIVQEATTQGSARPAAPDHSNTCQRADSRRRRRRHQLNERRGAPLTIPYRVEDPVDPITTGWKEFRWRRTLWNGVGPTLAMPSVVGREGVVGLEPDVSENRGARDDIGRDHVTGRIMDLEPQEASTAIEPQGTRGGVACRDVNDDRFRSSYETVAGYCDRQVDGIGRARYEAACRGDESGCTHDSEESKKVHMASQSASSLERPSCAVIGTTS